MALTKYPEGSLRELCVIAFPLMISSLSVMAMVFTDRLLLASYSPAAMNAAVNATTFGWAFLFGWMVMCGISEVFVAQFNGAKEYHKLGRPVWQMIWLSLSSIAFFAPLAIWGGEWVYPGEEYVLERTYFEWMMLFGPSYALFSALCGFFIGKGKIALITGIAIAANVINASLDYVLIFGIEGFLDPMGVKGAAIATSGSSVFETLVLFAIFLRKENQEKYGTGLFKFSSSLFWQCFRVGFPGAIFVMIEVLGWAAYYAMMDYVSERHITIVGIAQSIVLLLLFLAEGVNKAASAVAGNLIGAKKPYLIKKMVKAGFLLHLIFFAFLCLGCAFYSDWVTGLFLTKADPAAIASMQETLRICVFLTIGYLLFEGMRMVISGVLTAAGDTMFLLIAGSLSVWFLLVIPNYYFIVYLGLPVEVGSFTCVLYALAAFGIYLVRFVKGQWKELSITTSDSSSDSDDEETSLPDLVPLIE